ncbi:MAG: aminotransferase class I/II-fold pyridoxal phosphate-dependent enzyme [Bacteroidales bacterium]|nr:aminotransferase class I/II-fold pyridoxal phosphate-dependent enzyme [Bacteroidales bacterium]
MTNKKYSRRTFLKKSALTGLGIGLAAGATPNLVTGCAKGAGNPAILGGQAVRDKGWPDWPVWKPDKDEERIIEVLRSGDWWRGAGNVVEEFEQKWAETIGAKRCVATVNGTNSLVISLFRLGIGPGDEVIVPPYTFIATIQSVLLVGAMPVFVDTDPATFQIDADKIEEKITPRTAAILPVHILGLPADMEKIMNIARRHDLFVVEDACQAWLAEINDKKTGTFGHAGCFSFQNSKHLPIGEGGAIVSDDEELMDRCFSHHNNGRSYGTVRSEHDSYPFVGTNNRMTEYQAAVGLAQLKRMEEQTKRRVSNAEYLRNKIKDIPGILPYELYDNVTRAAFHLFPFRYKKEEFQGLPRQKFLSALNEEGIPCSGGYSPLNKMSYFRDAFQWKMFQRVFPKDMLDFDRYVERNQCPENDRLCEEAVWFSQNLLLTEQSDMDDIARAIEKIYNNSEKIKKSV